MAAASGLFALGLPQAVSAQTAAAADVLEASGLRRIPELVLATGGSNSLNERSMTWTN
ncbi:hypothetical protein [Burkholderia multivorans]|uniref:hypothetical protein n=1 Tax=Burkholderia multivorans TaxID=87883 RepID=UPI001C22BA86|nr:hypothetical protein [Burkholderia multivorans]